MEKGADKKTMKVNWKDNFAVLYKKLGQQKYGIRLLALWKIQSGMSPNEVSVFLKKSPRTINYWGNLYEKKGLDGLLLIRKSQRKKRILKKEDESKFTEVLNHISKQRELTARDIQEILRIQFQADYRLWGVYSLLKRLGYSRTMPPYIHLKENKKEIS